MRANSPVIGLLVRAHWSHFGSRGDGEAQPVQGPLHVQSGTVYSQDDQRWHPLGGGGVVCPHEGIAIVGTGDNLVVYRGPVNAAHDKIMLLMVRNNTRIRSLTSGQLK